MAIQMGQTFAFYKLRLLLLLIQILQMIIESEDQKIIQKVEALLKIEFLKDSSLLSLVESDKWEQSKQAFQQIEIQQYTSFLKDYRAQVKPPIHDEQITARFCVLFEDSILPKTIQIVQGYISTKRKNKKQDEQIIKINRQSVDKVLLYTWQLINFRVLLCKKTYGVFEVEEGITHKIHLLCILTCRIYISKWGIEHVTLKSMQISYFNLLKNKFFSSSPSKNGSICCLIQAILADLQSSSFTHYHNLDTYFLKNQQKGNEKLSFQSQKRLQKTTVQAELQWFTYIIQYCINNCQDFLKQTYTQLSGGDTRIVTNSGLSFLHFVSLLLNKVVNDRTTTQVVRGYSCPISQVRDMYSKSNSEGLCHEVKIKLSWIDYEWIIDHLLIQTYKKYKSEISNVWQSYLNGTSSEYIPSYAYCIMTIIGIVNCCIFLGGYVPALQKKTTKLVLQLALQLLQISYIIYELCHAKGKSIQIKIHNKLEKDYVKNLTQILKSEQKKVSQAEQTKPKQSQTCFGQQYQSLSLKKVLPLQQGQLVHTIRLLSNLVHINEEAQLLFEANLKYFRIIMSLTHEHESQLTMKNWAIVFLKNVSERSSVMRGQLEKLQITLKVDKSF